MDKIIFTKRFGTTKILPFLKKPMVLAPRLSLDGDVELGLEGREGFEGGLKQYNKDIIFTGLV